MVAQRVTTAVTVLTVIMVGLLLASKARALPSAILLEGSGDYDYDYSSEPVSASKPLMKVSSDDDVLDPIEDTSYPEDDDEYGTPLNISVAMPPLEIVVPEVDSDNEPSSLGSTEESATNLVETPVRFGLMETLESDESPKWNTTITVGHIQLPNAPRGDLAVTPAPDCRGFQVNIAPLKVAMERKLVH